MNWQWAATQVRVTAGVALGVPTAAVGLVFLLVAGLAEAVTLPLPAARRAVRAATLRAAALLTGLERWRLVRFLPGAGFEVRPAAERRTLGYLAARLGPGLLGGLAVGVLGVGVVLASIVAASVLDGRMSPATFLYQVVIGAALLLINVQALSSVATWDVRLARTFLAPSARELLERRVDELAASRAGVIAAVDTERQRIERDLHDGLQQRLVALGMLLGRARRSQDPDKVRGLVAQAHEDAQHAIDDLREVAWRVYPSALDSLGLDEVLAMVAQRSAVPVTIVGDLGFRPARQVETVLYFVACEALTNAAKHSGATRITVELTEHGTGVALRVHDDGTGGADPAGPGLLGLARRVTALDGSFRVDSPPGGPTTLLAVLPCG
ncbi:sensor histidine kinase [Longispora urticae]